MISAWTPSGALPIAIEDVDLPTTDYNMLKRGGYQTVEQVLAAGVDGLTRVRNLGPVRANNIMRSLKRWRESQR
jgi:DNA-directed RNA polymerase alpha subunit